MLKNKVSSYNMSLSFGEFLNFSFLFVGSFFIFLASLFLFFKINSDMKMMDLKIKKYNHLISEKEDLIMKLETIFNASTTHFQIKNLKERYPNLHECKVYNIAN